MFTIKAGFSDTVEVRTTIERVRDFLTDIDNFTSMMPGVIAIHTDAQGIMHWKVEAEIPLVGKMIQKFDVMAEDDDDGRIDWGPVPGEQANFLRFSAEFIEKAIDRTQVRFLQMVELRRRSARDLHLLAGLAGESLISREMTARVTEMTRTFIERAKNKLESVSN